MNRLEKNLHESFARARSDIVKLQEQILKLSENQSRLMEEIAKKNNNTSVRTVIKKEMVRCKPKKHAFIASKTGKKFHIPECPFTRNIKPKSMVKFKAKNTALNAGYKPCDCVK